ncbi:MAG: hypothetical protein ACI841_000535 [Planctomycetota bacterium]|jgi:hypothetical protein
MQGEPNSQRPSGVLVLPDGSMLIVDNGFAIETFSRVSNQPGILFYGTALTDIPFGNGRLFVTGGLNRINPPIMMSPMGGGLVYFDFTSGVMGAGSGQILAGAEHFSSSGIGTQQLAEPP